MDSWCGKILRAVFILPLMAGNYRRRRSGSWYYDCTISSRVLFLIVLSIVTVFTASRGIYTHTQIRLGFVLILLSIIMISAVIGFCIIGYLVNKHGLRSVVAARRDTRTPKLQVVFIWMFGLASVCYCTFVMCKQIECSINSSGGLFWNILLTFNILLVVCLFLQMIVITYFLPYELKPTNLVNFTMYMLLIANVSMLLYVFLISNTFGFIWDKVHHHNVTSCLVNNSTISLLLSKSRPILKPTFTEFCLLSCTILLEIWSPTKVHLPSEETSDIEINDMHESERSPLLTAVPVEHRSRNEGRRTACQLVTQILSIVLGLAFTVCYVAIAMGIGNTDNIQYVAQIYELTLKILMMLSIFVGFFCLVNYCTPDNSSQALKSREYVYLLSAFGLFMLHIGKGIGGDVSPNTTSYTLLFYTSILSLFQDYLQVVFLLHANRCKKSDPRSNIDLLESVLILTMISNFILWLNDSFLISEFQNTRILQNEPWDLMYEYLLPIAVFYRYTSFLEYYAIFGQYNT
ncbi:uncharacterized protein LOC110460139 [Mizuhopecten yessoensis]|uniref:uncharacterized protein LOC110460139 n=1 Tax=Mizuhopecten yessoensis TaxID=6573 RepID=UPI000B45849B|nr:uncharacterized protein LOC110460139 [Mizuhopecten yessoensis]